MIRYLAHRARRGLDRLLHPGGRGAVILYHRVAERISDPYGLCIPPALFEEQVRAIAEVGRPLPLDDFAAALRTRALPDRAIAVSFDDGYIDNLEVAKPILERHGVPGLVFMTTGAGGRTREFWWDELERVLLQPGELPPRLELTITGTRHHFDLGADRTCTAAQQARQRSWHLLDETAPGARHEAFRQLYQLVQPLAPAERTRVLDELLAWAGEDAAHVRPDRRVLKAAEVAALVRDGTMSVGAHTVNHPALPSQPPDVTRMELEQSRQTLAEWCGTPVRGFAYPYGLYDDAAVNAARDAGFDYACSGVYSAARPGTDPFLIPRIEAAAVSGSEFREMLRWQLR